MAFNQEKGLIAIGLRDGTIEVRDALTGDLKTTMPAETPITVDSLAFNKEGTKLAYGLDNFTLWMVDLDSSTLIPRQLSPTTADYNAYAVAFSPDGKYLVVGGPETKVHLLDSATGIELSVQRAVDPSDSKKGQREIFSIAFTPDSKQVISGGYGDDYALSIWHIESGDAGKTTLVFDNVWKADNSLGLVSSIAVFQDSSGRTKIATASIESIGVAVRLWDLATGRSSSPGLGHTAAIYSLAFSSDGRYLVSGGADLSLRLWDVTTNTPRSMGNAWIGHLSSVTGIAFTGGDHSVVSASLDRTIRIWDVSLPQVEGAPWRGATGSPLLSVATSPDGKYIVTGAEDGTVQLWNASSGESVAVTHLQSRVESVAFNPLIAQQEDPPRVAIGLSSGRGYVWNLDLPHSSLNYIAREMGGMNSVAFTADGKYIVLGSGYIADSEGRVQVWDVTTRKILYRWTTATAVRIVAISPPGACPGETTCVAAGVQSGALYLWDLVSGQPLITPTRKHADVILSLAFSPAGTCSLSKTQLGTCLISGSADRSINMWTLSGDVIGAPWIGHGYWVNSVAFSPDGRYVITGSADNTLRLWDAATHTPIGQPWVGHTDFVYGIAFMADGQHVVSVALDGTLRMWAVRSMPQMIAWACENRFARPFSSEELATYAVQEDISPSTCAAIEANSEAQSMSAEPEA
jgi:WD40 repeat protein